jgi:misacylated tRNA(Ala) deacylase
MSQHGQTQHGQTQHGRTQRLELADSNVRAWEAEVLAIDPELGIVLDRSAFYPGGGGQPPDHGVLLWGGVETKIVDARRKDDLWLVPAEGDPIPPVGTKVKGALADERRFALMRTHSGLHLLSGVVCRDFGALVTGSNMDTLTGRLDFNLDSIPEGFKESIETACNIEVNANQGISAYELSREEAFNIPDVIRTASNLLPPSIQIVRIVDINGLDVQADGGTHVASTSQVGAMRVLKVENKGKGFRRIRIALAA